MFAADLVSSTSAGTVVANADGTVTIATRGDDNCELYGTGVEARA